MPPAPDLTPLIAAISSGFASLVAAIGAGQAVDLAPLTAEIKRVADAVEASNAQVAGVIGADSAGDNRVRINPLVP